MKRTHTKLAQTALRGSSEIVLEESVDWPTDSQILITSTASNGTFEEAETATLSEVLDGGLRVRLASPLLYDHLGEIVGLAGGHNFEFRANVALLSRNVVIQGDTKSALDKHGAHILLHSRTHNAIVDRSKGESLTGRIENIELRYAGQMGRLGRYSIHFHMIGAVQNSYVRSSSVHHTYNRMIALHGVHFLRVQNNIGFENMGHALFIEDGVETRNVITGNLIANTRESFAMLTTDATPASYWLVNGDNYVEGNIAAGSTHYGFWFFPEPKVRGKSENDPGSDQVCPQGVPLLRFADNEAHNNKRYGLRIFTGKEPTSQVGNPGFYPKRTSSCDEVSESNPFEPAQFLRQYSWRNGKNGVTVGSVAALQLVKPVVVDNIERGIEMTGADGVIVGLQTETKLRGPWGANLIQGAILAAHVLPCPACDRSLDAIYTPMDGGWKNKRLGLETAAWFGLTVENTTFINYDRDNLIAVAGFAKALPPHGSGYDFRNAGGMETRFKGIKWLESNNRVRWRWPNEALFVDVDGTFTGHAPGSSVLENDMISNERGFPECFHDPRYGGTVCGPALQFVLVGFLPHDPALIIHDMEASYHLADKTSNYVTADDVQYLRNKFYPKGQYHFVELDLTADAVVASVVGWRRQDVIPWNVSTGSWISRRQILFSVIFVDEFTQKFDHVNLVAELSEDDSTLTWVNGSDFR